MLTAIWTIFALICCGFVLARKGFPSDAFWPSAERLNYYILFPALLVSNLANAPIRDPQILRLGASAVTTIMIGTAILYILRALRPTPTARFGAALQGVLRFNTYLALSVLAMVAGVQSLERAAVYLAISVPLVNILAIIALSDRAVWRSPIMLVKKVGMNPLVLACITGALLAITKIGLPFGSEQVLKLLAQGSLPLGLLCVGAALRPSALGQDILPLIGNALARLVLMPCLAIGVAYIFDLSSAETLVLLVFSAVPTAPSSYVLTRQMGGDGTFMAGIVTLQTVGALITIPVVLHLYGAS
jgi:malonate transporter and related proteins